MAVAVTWETCRAGGCMGASVEGGRCLAHLEGAAFDRALERAKRSGALVAQGVVVSGELFERLLEAFRDEGKERRFKVADVEFAGATFEEAVHFAQIVFEGRARFEGAVFRGQVSFSGALFKHSPLFEGATFESDALFGYRGPAVKAAPDVVWDTVFQRRGQFADATFRGQAVFTGASFGDAALFDGTVFEQGVDFESAHFERVLSLERVQLSAPASFARAQLLGDVRLRGAALTDARFDSAVFGSPLVWSVSQASGDLSFTNAVFEQSVNFIDYFFQAGSYFGGATFGGVADFGTTRFARAASFDGATFVAGAVFVGAVVDASASPQRMSFTRTTFKALARFDGVSFVSGASFDEAAFESEVVFTAARFGATASFRGTRFERARTIGPIAAYFLELNEALFQQPTRMEIAAGEVSCAGTQFAAGANLRLRWAEIAFEETEFGRASTLAGSPRPFVYEDDLENAVVSDPVRSAQAPRIMSLRRTDVARLTLSGVDLRACRFGGAINLDGLRMEEARFARPPAGRRWTHRRVIAEEHVWRESRNRDQGWFPRECRLRRGIDEPLEARQIASVYRALRKGREDSKDEPGAADFYYGEMEMRRHGSDSRAEQSILFLYWLVSGYGLRASRALAALAVTVVAFAFLFDAWGFRTDESLGTALLFSVESTTSLLRGTDRQLTSLGETLWIALRLLGPLFFGLAILSLRGRVKR